MTVAVPASDHLFIVLDHDVLQWLAEQDQLVWVSEALRQLLSHEHLNTCGTLLTVARPQDASYL
jgi:hypothetical protein